MKITFKYARSMCYLMVIGAIFFFLLPILFPKIDPARTHMSRGYWTFFWFAALGELVAAIYYFKYEIELDSSSLRYGRFSKKEILFKDMDFIRYRKDVRVDAIDVATKAGHVKTFTSSVDQFSLFWTELRSRTTPFHVRCEQP